MVTAGHSVLPPEQAVGPPGHTVVNEGHWVCLGGQTVGGPAGQPVGAGGQAVIRCGQEVVTSGQRVDTAGQTVEVVGAAVGASARRIGASVAAGPEGAAYATPAPPASMRATAVFNVFTYRGESWVSSANKVPDQVPTTHRKTPPTSLRPMAVPSQTRMNAWAIRGLDFERAHRPTSEENRPTARRSAARLIRGTE